MLYTGVDYHRRFSYLTTMNEKGEIIAQKKLPSNHEIVDFLKEKRPGISRRFYFKVERKKSGQSAKTATATRLPEWIYHVF